MNRLKVLEEYNLVIKKAVGNSNYYSLNLETADEIISQVDN